MLQILNNLDNVLRYIVESPRFLYFYFILSYKPQSAQSQIYCHILILLQTMFYSLQFLYN